MTKLRNTSKSSTIRVTISRQSEALLDKLAATGVYGRNGAEVAARFIDEALQRFIELPKFKVRSESERE
jgi:hypothetical protein